LLRLLEIHSFRRDLQLAMNLDKVFRESARRFSAQPAILGPGPGDALTYRALDEAIGAAANRLTKAGLRFGDCVGLHQASGADYVISAYAVWRCGACVVPIPVELASEEKQQICRDISMDFVMSELTTGRQRTTAAPTVGKSPPTDMRAISTESFLQPFVRGIATEVLPGTAIVPIRSPRTHPNGFAAINAAFIRFTSGTTGLSKGVVLSHETIFERVLAANEVLRIGRGDRVTWLLSMSYHFAVTIVGYLSLGAAIVLTPNHFAEGIVNSARQHEATLIYGSPAHYAWLSEYSGQPLPSSMRLALSTTCALDRSTAEKFNRRHNLPVTQALGIIEVGLPFINIDFADSRGEALGRVLPAYRLRMDDVGLGRGRKEILLSGPGLLDAYYHPWQTRAAILHDGWFRTGDVGELDGDGCLYLRGRIKDIISVMGMKFFPQEVERVLMSHPRVAAACVLARRDDRLGEVPVARVVTTADSNGQCSESQLLELCRKRLAPYKVPERVEFVPALPRTVSGKVLHRD
jgi:long-chain acyl-CoA synthetase